MVYSVEVQRIEPLLRGAALLVLAKRRPFGGRFSFLGALMGIREIRRCVISCSATTAIANAFRKALGLPMLWARPKAAVIVSMDAYKDIADCFANAESPMDGRT